MENEQLIEILNDLSTINRERAKAYEEASFQNHVFGLELRGTFALLANQSRQNNFLLKQQLEKLPVNTTVGKKPLPQLTFGYLYKQWQDMGVSFTGADFYEMLQACERGEEAIQATYLKALDVIVSSNLRQLLENQLRGLQNCHNIIRGILNNPPKMMAQKIKKSS